MTAFFNPVSGLGYAGGRIFMNGEEVSEGRAFAHIVSGAENGNSYELPRLGNMAFENAVANPHTGDKTVVALDDDTSPHGQVYFYFGDKQSNAGGGRVVVFLIGQSRRCERPQRHPAEDCQQCRRGDFAAATRGWRLGHDQSQSLLLCHHRQYHGDGPEPRSIRLG